MSGRIVRGGGEGSATVSTGGSRKARSTTTALPKFFPEIEPTYQVGLNSTAGRVIRSQINRERYTEVGGWLFCAPHNSSVLVAATGPGSDGALGRSTVHIGTEEIETVKEIAPHLTLCGDWHVHPSADTLPSDTDRRAWQRGAELTRSHWIGLIFAPAANVWSEPQCSAWITVANGTLPFCEPLRLREI
jgi:Prokaryotic homologs of the JAB domain